MKITDEAVLTPFEALALIESRGVGTWSWHLETGELSWSVGVSHILGVDHGAFEQTLPNFEDMLHAEDRLDYRNPAHLAVSGVLAERQYRIIRPSGEMRWVRSHGKVVHSREGRPERVVGVSFDITDAWHGLRAAQQSDGLIDAIRELFDVVVWTTDGNGEVTDELDWWRATGQAGRVDGWKRLEAVHPDDRARVREAWAEALRGRRRYYVSCRVKWGEIYVPVISRANPMIGLNGDIDGWVGFTARQDSAVFGLDVPREDGPPLSPGQVRAARGFLGWSAEQLAERAGVSFSTVRRVETPGERAVREQSLAAVRKALERAGITFTSGSDGRIGVSIK